MYNTFGHNYLLFKKNQNSKKIKPNFKKNKKTTFNIQNPC